jgi:hypothetical protein
MELANLQPVELIGQEQQFVTFPAKSKLILNIPYTNPLLRSEYRDM